MSQIKLTNEDIKILYGVGGVIGGGLVVGGLFKLFKYLSSKTQPAPAAAAAPEHVEDDDELDEVTTQGTEEERASDEASIVDLNIPNNDEEEWKTGKGGKRSRKRKNNKSKKSRSKSKRRTKK